MRQPNVAKSRTEGPRNCGVRPVRRNGAGRQTRAPTREVHGRDSRCSVRPFEGSDLWRTTVSTTDTGTKSPTPLPPAGTLEMRLEVVVVPVADVDRARSFYETTIGFRLDADFTADDGLRVVQVTPPGSLCSVIFGHAITAAAPGSSQDLMLVVHDVAATRADLVARGVEVSEVFHDVGGVFHHGGTDGRLPGPDPEGRSYSSFVSFSDPDGNGWVLQEIRTRLPGR